MRLVPALIAALLAVPCAHAGETAWQDVAPGVSVRLISTGEIRPDGTTLVGIEIHMPETSKTYWRVPGDTGLPTTLDFAASAGVTDHDILWPYPHRDQTEDYLDYVYYGPTVLPVALKVSGNDPVAEVDAVLGICSDICVPAQVQFRLPLVDARPDRVNGLRVRQAMALVPAPWTDQQEPVGSVEFWADKGMLAVPVEDASLDAASLIAATPDGEPVFGTPQKSPEPGLVLIPVLDGGDSVDLEDGTVELTFMTGLGAFAVTRPVSTVRGTP